jgi:hypothetical protein
LTALPFPVGYVDNSCTVTQLFSLDAAQRLAGHGKTTNAESVNLLFPGFTLRLVQDPAFERITHVFRETRSVYLDQEMYGRSDDGIRGREFTLAATGCRTPVEKSAIA